MKILFLYLISLNQQKIYKNVTVYKIHVTLKKIDNQCELSLLVNRNLEYIFYIFYQIIINNNLLMKLITKNAIYIRIILI